MLGGIEKTETGGLIAIVYYKDFRIIIAVTEMMINLLQDAEHDTGNWPCVRTKSSIICSAVRLILL